MTGDDARHEELTRLLTDCLDTLYAGDVAAARSLAERAARLADGFGCVAIASAALVSGMVERADRDHYAAADAYATAARLAVRHLAEPEAPRIYVQAQVETAALHTSQGRYRQAEQVLKRALTSAVHGTTDPLDLALLHNEIGVVCKHSGRFRQAADSYRHALALLESAAVPDPIALAVLWHNIGGLAHAQGDYQAAEQPARRAVALRQEALGPDHPDVAADKAALAPILLELGHLDEAQALLRDALTVYDRVYGPDHPEYAIALGNLAALAHRRGELTVADLHYRRALAILEHRLGADHPDLAAILANHATLRRTLGDRDTADALDARAHAILTDAVQPDHPTLQTVKRHRAPSATPAPTPPRPL